MEASKILEQHPLAAELIPAMPAADLRDLANDIKSKGQLHPIRTFEGKVLVGWSRYQACVTEGIEPSILEYDGDDPVGFIASEDVHRRHMTPADRRKVAKALAVAHPEYSDRRIAEAAGLGSHHTVAAIREEVKEEGNGQSAHWVDPGSERSLGVGLDPIGANAEPRLGRGFTKSGEPRKAPGRKPYTAEQKAAAAAAVKEPKIQRSASSLRSDWILMTDARLKTFPVDTLHDLVTCVMDRTALIQDKMPEPTRREAGERFLSALGFAVTLISVS